MSSDSIEQTIITNMYGTVTSKRVTYFAKKGWFSGGSREDVPLKQVVSVRYETSRRIAVRDFIVLVIGLWLSHLIQNNLVYFLFGLVLIAFPIYGWGWQGVIERCAGYCPFISSVR